MFVPNNLMWIQPNATFRKVYCIADWIVRKQPRRICTSVPCSSSQTNRNYYEILGLRRNATAKEIRHAYIVLSKKHHPDTRQSGTVTQEKDVRLFQEIQEAYSTLSKPQSRSVYDQTFGPGVGFSEAKSQRAYDGKQRRPSNPYYDGAQRQRWDRMYYEEQQMRREVDDEMIRRSLSFEASLMRSLRRAIVALVVLIAFTIGISRTSKRIEDARRYGSAFKDRDYLHDIDVADSVEKEKKPPVKKLSVEERAKLRMERTTELNEQFIRLGWGPLPSEQLVQTERHDGDDKSESVSLKLNASYLEDGARTLQSN